MVLRVRQPQLGGPTSSPVTVPINIGDAVAAGAGVFSVSTEISFSVGNATAAGSQTGVTESGQIAAGVGNAVAGGPSGATVTEDITLAASIGNAVAAGAVATLNQTITLPLLVGNAVATGLTASISIFNPNIVIGCFVGNADAAGQRCEILPPLTVAPSATPGYAPRTRYRVRVGSRWMEVDPLDPMSVRRAYDAAQEDAQDAATQDVQAPAAVAAQAVVVQPIKGPDYAGLAKEARRISEDIRKVYADALQTALIARLMREQIERDDEDDIAVLLASI